MALTDKNIVITPNIGQTADPKIVFSGADATTGAQNITLQVYPTNNGTLSFEGSNGQIFSINNNFTGTIFSVNDVSGIPSIEVLDTGEIRMAQYGGFVDILSPTNATNTNSGALQVVGGAGIGGSVFIGGNLTVSGLITGNVSLSGSITTASNLALGTVGQVPYQSAAGVTSFFGPGTAGQILLSGGAGAPVYTNTASIYVNSAVNAETLRGGTAGQLHYQSGAGTTAFLSAGTSGQILVSAGAAAPTWTNTGSLYVNSSVFAEDLRGGAAGQIPYQSAANNTVFTAAGVNGQILVSGGTGSPVWQSTLTLTSTLAATSTATGALVVAGGVGVGGNLWVGGTLYATVAGSITTATNIAGGTAGALLYQTAAGATNFIGIGSNGFILRSNGSTATWVDPATTVSGIANTATNLAGGLANQIPYQSGPGATTFSANLTFNGSNLTVGGIITGNSIVPSAATVPTNGMYLPAANQIAFATNSTGHRITVTSGGLVGVNNNNPNAILDVGGSMRVSGIVTATSDVYVSGNAYASNNLNRNARVDAAETYPTGHYTSGESVWEIDPTWSQAQLQAYFNTTAVTWFADSTAPGGYSVQIDGAINVGGGINNAGFPYIPIDSSDIFYMECWIKQDATYVGGGHYMGSEDFNESFGSLGGNPGSYGYWVMANNSPGSTWTKYSGYCTGFSASATGTFRTGSKYWTPQALFNYSYSSGTRRCWISGWKVYKVYQTGNRYWQGIQYVQNSTAASGASTGALQVSGGASVNGNFYGGNVIAGSTQIASGRLSVFAGGAGAVGWGTGLNIGDASNYTSILQDGGYFRTRNNGNGQYLWYNAAASAATLTLDNSGNAYFTGNVYSSYSDINLKTVLGKIENPLDIVRSIETFYYEPNELAIKLGATPGRQVGLSAQSAKAVHPEVTAPSPINKEYLTVQYERLVPVLLESVKALEDLVKAQDEKIKQLEEKLNGTLSR